MNPKWCPFDKLANSFGFQPQTISPLKDQLAMFWKHFCLSQPFRGYWYLVGKGQRCC